ncbi:Oxysterol-binding protein OBPa [Umbelopsis sp. WA50703]
MSKNDCAGDPDSTEVLEEGSRSILLSLASQLRKGMDLHRVTLPTFVLEPRSMLERITDFFSHSDYIIEASKQDDQLQRFIGVVRYYLSGWHIKPKGVKKPYNPVLGEFYRCQYKYPDNTEGYYVAEQVSHHPPISAYYYASPENGIVIAGDIRPKSKFLGNSAATLMQGSSHIIFTNRHNERYDIVMPNMYARGILFGTMTLELGDASSIRCISSDLICELEFKTKGFFSGQWNSLAGKIKRESTGEVLFELSGQWSNEIYIKMSKASSKNTLFDVKESKIFPKTVAPESEQEPNESQRQWADLTEAIRKHDMDGATDAKSAVEDKQRHDAKIREDEGVEWRPRFFDAKNDDFILVGADRLDFTKPEDTKKQLRDFIFAKHEDSFHSRTENAVASNQVTTAQGQ